jgi:hypothetical protein
VKHAKPANFGTFMDDVAEACADLWRLGKRAAVAIAALPWPALLAASIMLAFAITIVPLALALFVLFLLVKLVVAAFIVNKRRRGD